MRPATPSLRFAAFALIAWVTAVQIASAEDTIRHYRIAVQSLDQALREFALASQLDLLFSPQLVAGKKNPSIDGEFTVDAALRTLLRGSGLQFSVSGSRVVITEAESERSSTSSTSTSAAETIGEHVRRSETETRSSPSSSLGGAMADRDSPSTKREPQKGAGDEEIVVTGSRIKGARPSSPVMTISQKEIRLSGWNNLGEVVRALPQNFSGGQNPGVATGASNTSLANINVTGSSSLNLRGLGPDATLTLLNGARLPYDGLQQATDVSMIPVAAIERIEILLDGASAIYGSDAVGGVANVIVKRDFQGLELSARYGEATDGGYEQRQFNAVTGQSWSSGGVLLAADYSANEAVRARQRDYLQYLPGQSDTIYPALTAKGGLISGHQELGSLAELTFDAFYTERLQEDRMQAFAVSVGERDAQTWGVVPALTFNLPAAWSLRIQGATGRNEVDSRTRAFNVATGALTSENRVCFCNEAESAGVEAQGPLFGLPGGQARFAFGGGYRRNVLQSRNLITGATVIGGKDQSYSGYGEIDLPLVSPEQGIRLLTRLSLNGALRYENYDSFGNTTTPKLGVTWGLARGLDIRASWGKSFKVPTLSQQHTARSLFLLAGAANGAPAGTTVLVETGGNPSLGPERAEIISAGLAASPASLPNLSVELNWFDIDYSDRVVDPLRPFNLALANPNLGEFITRAPTVERQNAAIAQASAFTNLTPTPYNPASVHAILHNRFANATAQRSSGVDLTARYTWQLFGGTLATSLNSSWLDSERQLTSLSPEVPTAGVNFFPVDFRGLFGVSWSGPRLTLTSNVNHTDGIKNTDVNPNAVGASMTTVDLVIDYRTREGQFGDLSVNVSAANLFNRRPPFLQPGAPFFVNYDSTNYSPIGRVVNATLTKRF